MQYRLSISLRALKLTRQFYKLSTPRITQTIQLTHSYIKGVSLKRGLDLTWTPVQEIFAPLSGFTSREYALGFNVDLIRLKQKAELTQRSRTNFCSFFSLSKTANSYYYTHELGDSGSKSLSTRYDTLSYLNSWTKAAYSQKLKHSLNHSLNSLIFAWWFLITRSNNFLIKRVEFFNPNVELEETSDAAEAKLQDYAKTINFRLGPLEQKLNNQPAFNSFFVSTYPESIKFNANTSNKLSAQPGDILAFYTKDLICPDSRAYGLRLTSLMSSNRLIKRVVMRLKLLVLLY